MGNKHTTLSSVHHLSSVQGVPGWLFDIGDEIQSPVVLLGLFHKPYIIRIPINHSGFNGMS